MAEVEKAWVKKQCLIACSYLFFCYLSSFTADIGGIFQPFGVSSQQFVDNTHALLHGPASSATKMVGRLLHRLRLP